MKGYRLRSLFNSSCSCCISASPEKIPDALMWVAYKCALRIRHYPHSQARDGEEKRAWFPLFAHVLNSGGIPPALWTFDYVCTLVTLKWINVIHTVNYLAIVREWCALQQLSIVLSYVLRRQDAPELSKNSDLRLNDGMFSCGCRRTDRVESVCYQTLPFVLNNECRVSLLLVAVQLSW